VLPAIQGLRVVDVFDQRGAVASALRDAIEEGKVCQLTLSFVWQGRHGRRLVRVFPGDIPGTALALVYQIAE